MPNSLCPDAERARRRLATFAQAIRSTSPQAAPRMAIGAAKIREAPSCAFQIGTIRAPTPSLVFGKAPARRAATVAASALAWETLTPGLSLTMAPKRRALRSPSPASGTGTHTSRATPGKSPWNSGGATPTMVTGCRFTCTVRPRMDGSPMKVVLPRPVADDRRERLSLVAVFLASERAAEDWLYAQYVEIVSGDEFEPRGRGVLSVADRGGSLLVERQSRDAFQVVLE